LESRRVLFRSLLTHELADHRQGRYFSVEVEILPPDRDRFAQPETNRRVEAEEVGESTRSSAGVAVGGAEQTVDLVVREDVVTRAHRIVLIDPFVLLRGLRQCRHVAHWIAVECAIVDGALYRGVEQSTPVAELARCALLVEPLCLP